MASTDGQAGDLLIGRLMAEPFRFDFFRALRVLQCLHPEMPPLGYADSPALEPVRLGQNPSLAFAPSTLEAATRSEPRSPLKIVTRHFGLFGPNGPLPLALTEYALSRIDHSADPTFAEFCNTFHHRLLLFFFRAWADARKEVDLDHTQNQRWPVYVGSLFGLGMDSVRHADAVPDFAKLYYSGRLTQQSRNAEGLEAILRDDFGVPIALETFVGRWITLPHEYHCRLGGSGDSNILGATAVVGGRVWDCQMSFRLRVGPLSLDEFERFLPQGNAWPRLHAWILNYLPTPFFWDALLILKKDQVPQTSLGHWGRLGWTTWLKTNAFAEDAADTVLDDAATDFADRKHD